MKMINNLIILDNPSLDFYPFCVLHPLFELRIGALKIYEKFIKIFDNSNITFKSEELKLNSFLKRHQLNNKNELSYNNCLIWNSKFLISKNVKQQIDNIIENNPFEVSKFIDVNNEVICYFFPAIIDRKINFSELFEEENSNSNSNTNSNSDTNKNAKTHTINNIKSINYIWDALDLVGDSIKDDIQFMNLSNHKYFGEGVFSINGDQVLLGEKVIIEPMVVLNASAGAIIIDDNAKIMSNSVIYGPCYIGKNSTIKAGAKIYSNTAIGEYCKVGGEVENSIFQAYSNKQHEGFLGHSFISEWVNLGADTNNSDLKNTYSNISMQLPHKLVNTNRIFLGLICGDHSKTGINSMFTTGTICGIGGILVKDWFLPNYIKSYTWGGKTNSPIYKVEKAIETAKIVMKRRNKELLEEEIELLKLEYQRVINE